MPKKKLKAYPSYDQAKKIRALFNRMTLSIQEEIATKLRLDVKTVSDIVNYRVMAEDDIPF